MGRISETSGYLKISSQLLQARVPNSVCLVLVKLDFHRNKQTGQCNPFQRTLAAELYLSQRCVEYAIRWLRDAGILKLRRNGRSSAWYELVPEPEWIGLVLAHKNCGLKGEPLTRTKVRIEDGSTRTKVRSRPANSADRNPQIVRIEPSVSINEKKIGKEHRTESAYSNERERSVRTAGARTPEPPRIEPPEPEPKPPEEEFWSSPERVAEDATGKLLALHPRAGQPKKARAIIRRLCLAHADDLYGLIERIGISHRAWRPVWSAGGYVPMLWEWFDSGDWEQVPTEAQVRKPPNRHEPEWLTATRARVEARKALETGA